MSPVAGRTTVATAHEVDQFDRLGFFVLDRAFHPDTMADVVWALTVAAGAADAMEPPAQPDLAPSRVLRRFCAHPLLAGLARDLVGPDVRVHREGRVSIPPAGVRPVFTYDRPVGGPGGEPHLTCWVALTDAVDVEGRLQIAGGHHRRVPTLDLTDAGDADDENCRVTDVDPAGVIDVPVGAGSVVVMSSLTPRRTRRTTAATPALAYVVQYAPDAVIHIGSAEGAPLPSPRQFAVVRSGQLTGPS